MNTRFNKLSQFTKTILNIQSLDELNKLIVEDAKKLTGADYGALFLKTTDKLNAGYISHPILTNILTKKNLKNIQKVRKTTIVPNNLLQGMSRELIKHDIKSFLVLPIYYQHEQLAVLFLTSLQPDHFTDDDSEAMQTFLSIAALAIKKELTTHTSEKALELRDRFISLASHELRTPMTSITGYIQLLYGKMKNNSNLEPRWIEALYSESIRMNTLVKEILDINRIKQGQFAFFFGEVNITEAVEKAIERYQTTYPEYPILFENQLSDKNSIIIGDFDKLVEMTSGVISNAIKFSQPESKITISLKANNRMIILTVQDHGKGISKEDLEAMFQGFFKSSNPNIEGMGVGLFLAKNIADHHRGKIQVSSKANKGTLVKITLPRPGKK